MCRGRVWRPCSPSTACARRAANWPSNSAGIHSTALDDLLGIEEGKVNDTRLYRCLDRMLPHKTKLERHLKQRYGELFGAEFDVLLYDLTSTLCGRRGGEKPHDAPRLFSRSSPRL